MNLEMRPKLAKLPFEKKIQMAGYLVKLARELKKASTISLEEFWNRIESERQRKSFHRARR
jgi:hypothetical protein